MKRARGFHHQRGGPSKWARGRSYGSRPDSRTAQAPVNNGPLEQRLWDLDGQSYGQYKLLLGQHPFPTYDLYIDYVQSDPYAPPSHIRLRVDQAVAKFPSLLFNSPIRHTALCDYVTRRIFQFLSGRGMNVHENSGGGGRDFWAVKGARLTIDPPGQQVLERTSVDITNDYVEARMSVRLPARGRSIVADEAHRVLIKALPTLVADTMLYGAYQPEQVLEFVDCLEDQAALRGMLPRQGLIGFVRNGAILPRKSGISDHPLATEGVVKFQSPSSLEMSFTLLHTGTVTGMGIKKGITLIAGGGFHGKSTLLQALEKGIYNHIPGDGREFVCISTDMVKIKAEDGRPVTQTDITPFINNLPFGKQTTQFSTDDASGSTSMAAGIQEALEMGCTGFLFDEDTCATNFLIRDQRMQTLVPKSKEPITPLIAKVGTLSQKMGVSTILVAGGCGDYLDVADTVICMENYRPHDATAAAIRIAQQYPTGSQKEAAGTYGTIPQRHITVPKWVAAHKPPAAKSLHQITLPLHTNNHTSSEQNPAYDGKGPRQGRGRKAGTRDDDGGTDESSLQLASRDDPLPSISLAHLDQLCETSQTRALAALLVTFTRLGEAPSGAGNGHQLAKLIPSLYQNGHGKAPTMQQWLDLLDRVMDQQGLAAIVSLRDSQWNPAAQKDNDALAAQIPNALSRPRRYEIGAMLNRLRGLAVTI
ncbi:hypothetical protein H4R34_003678 [Dimargaris verticillata]|uniref:ATPase of the ABC class n=1 Tax=Dimargaris verticillata TaxID=2761393 RepID=A0A9W8ECE1_9FUNG|nr:hypothetical protein H4R34_003678 [Dimargaris verticillata]